MSGHSVIPKTIELKDAVHEYSSPRAWQLHGCSTLDKKTGSAHKTRLGNLHATLTNADRMWENEKEKVKAIVKEWEQYANIKFQFITGRNATVRIAFNEDPDDPSGGSWSYIAKDIDGIPKAQATMNYGWVTTGKDITDEDKGVVLHEFGHTLGFLHEHQSSRRGEKITLDEPAVIEFYMSTQGWTEQEVREQILNIYNDNEVSSFSSIDLTSIMMYFMPKEMNLERIEIKPNNVLSELGKAYAFINYPFFTTPSSNKNWTIDHALDVAGVQGDSRARILAEFKQKDSKGVRTEFALWSLNQKAAAIANKLAAKRAAALVGGASAQAGATPVLEAAPAPLLVAVAAA